MWQHSVSVNNRGMWRNTLLLVRGGEEEQPNTKSQLCLRLDEKLVFAACIRTRPER